KIRNSKSEIRIEEMSPVFFSDFGFRISSFSEGEAAVGFAQWLKGLFGGAKGAKGAKKSNVPRVDVNKRFDLLNRTGQGSMSKVWRARDKQLGRMVCVKLLDRNKTAMFE